MVHARHTRMINIVVIPRVVVGDSMTVYRFALLFLTKFVWCWLCSYFLAIYIVRLGTLLVWYKIIKTYKNEVKWHNSPN